ncbi:MAG TPA: 30S ribosomal protein S20 [Candidatus Aminicenantes bacterium]|nr:30S ribosomal protein S20 [Candidatus Aminicenantes bacterium]
MANHVSAIRQHRRDEKKRLINRMNRSKMKNKIKLLRKELAAGNQDAAKKLLPAVLAIIDKTVTKGTIHARTGSRYKSRLSQQMNKAGA